MRQHCDRSVDAEFHASQVSVFGTELSSSQPGDPEGKHISCGLHFRADRLSTDSQCELPMQKTGECEPPLGEELRSRKPFFPPCRPLNLLFSSCQPPPLSHFWHAAGMPASKVINDAVCSGAFLWARVGEPRFKLQIFRVRARLSCPQKNHGHVT